MGYDKPSDDAVGTPELRDDGRQTSAQKAVLGGGGEDGGRPEPKSKEDWRERGASGGEPGRPPVAIGGNSGGHGDRMPVGGPGSPDVPATNPKTRPGHQHEA
ncbi:hypothetical protein [uncultured Enterovirga sp.]|uniref:hypothetical protein n=1 Tax=uncultured Enterovirga sp. TaxID=2026352 RepID=UPI0035CB24AB